MEKKINVKNVNIKELKKHLEDSILSAIKEFEKLTDMEVYNLYLEEIDIEDNLENIQKEIKIIIQ